MLLPRSATALLAAAALLSVGLVGCLGASRFLGEPFPGFLLLENRVIASAGLGHWPATAGGEIYQQEVIAVNGEPLDHANDLRAIVRALPVGTDVTYTLRRDGRSSERVIATRRFELADFTLLFGVYLLNGLAMGGVALALWLLRGDRRKVRAALPLLGVGAFWALSALDLYGPYSLFRFHALCEVLLFPATLHMALAFPQPLALVRRNPSLLSLPYVFAAGLALVYQLGLQEPGVYVKSHLLATSALGLGMLCLIAFFLAHLVRNRASGPRRQLRALAAGTLVALALPVLLTLLESFDGGQLPQNAVGFTAFLFPISVGYAALRPGPLLRAEGDSSPQAPSAAR